jgi:hypothetical protein
MPIHDWPRVEAGIFHHFHHGWIEEIKRALNRGLLPSPYYALVEQIAGGRGHGLLPLPGPTKGGVPDLHPPGTIALATAPPRVHFRARTEIDVYATRAKAVVIRHVSGHEVIAVVEVVSPGNRNARHALRSFVTKAEELLRGGIHLLVVDLFPPGPRDPQGVPKGIWDEIIDNDFALPADRPLSVAAYIGGPCPEVFLEPTAVGRPLPDMPLFLTTEEYIRVPLEATYQAAWEAVPAYWRDVLAAPAGSGETGPE